MLICSKYLILRPLPPLPNLEVSEEFVGKVADEARVCINRVLAVGHDIAIRRDRKVFLQVFLLALSCFVKLKLVLCLASF